MELHAQNVSSGLLLSSVSNTVVVIIFATAATAFAIYLYRRSRVPTSNASEPTQSKRPPASTESMVAPATLIQESRFIEVNGVNVHYVQAGSGEDLVLLHGIGASVYIWRYLFPLLQTQFRVTALDLPGFGRSGQSSDRNYGLDAQTQLVKSALDAAKIGKARLIGSSMGGAIALWLAKDESERFPEVCVLSPATDSRLVSSRTTLLALGSDVFRHALNRRSMRFLLGFVIARKEVITDEVVDRYLEPFLGGSESVRSFLLATSLLADSRLPNELKELRSRVLVLYGKRDRIVLRRSIDRLIRTLPTAKLSLHAEGGHHIMEDEPAWVAHEILTFFGADPTSGETLPKSRLP